MSKVTETVTELTKEVIEKEGFELFDLEFVKEGKNWFLRFYLDKPGGIDLDDCAFMSEKFSEILDAQDPDPIPQAYFLEVSSPGWDRPFFQLEQLQGYIGQQVALRLIAAVENRRKFQAKLLAVDLENEEIQVEVEGKHVLDIDSNNIDKANLIYQD